MEENASRATELLGAYGSYKYLASEPLNSFLAKYLCLPGLAQETYSTIPVGAIYRADNEGDRDPSNRTDAQHLIIYYLPRDLPLNSLFSSTQPDR